MGPCYLPIDPATAGDSDLRRVDMMTLPEDGVLPVFTSLGLFWDFVERYPAESRPAGMRELRPHAALQRRQARPLGPFGRRTPKVELRFPLRSTLIGVVCPPERLYCARGKVVALRSGIASTRTGLPVQIVRFLRQ
jgi:hypothetical protein